MARTLLNVLVLLLAVGAGVFQFYVKPLLTIFGIGRVIESIGNQHCSTVPQLKACEKIVIHQPTGVLYLACSTPESRTFWTPALSRLNASAASRNDFVATYNPASGHIMRLTVSGFTSARGLSLHGMDVVPSTENPNELFVYLVNHRAPLGDRPASEIGADSVIEVFKTTVGGTKLEHLRTVEDDVIIAPNDIIGAPDGKSFYFTNDHAEKVGHIRELDLLGRAKTSVGYCALDAGCKFAIMHMPGSNGIVRAPNGTVYVANSNHGGLSILEPQSDHSLVLVDTVKADRGMDNLSIDTAGNIWAASFPKATILLKHFSDPTIPSPTSALRFSRNTSPDAFYGKKYKVEKVFEDDGTIASGVTSVAYDAERNRLFLHGLASPHLAICTL